MKLSLTGRSDGHANRVPSRAAYGGERSDRLIWRALNHEIARIPQASKELQELARALEERLHFHREMLIKTKSRMHAWSVALALTIPVLSALLTWAITPPRPLAQWEWGLSIAGLALTILTIINSVLRPSEKDTLASHTLVRLHDWEVDLVTRLRHWVPPQAESTERDMLEFLADKDRQLSTIGNELADQLSPKVPPLSGKDGLGSGDERSGEATQTDR